LEAVIAIIMLFFLNMFVLQHVRVDSEEAEGVEEFWSSCICMWVWLF